MATKIEEIKELMKKSLNIKELKEEDTLATYGLDSLDVVEFILDLEEKFDISFETDDTKDIKTVGDLLKTIEKKIV
ncbi:MAG TPA: phosphopantetheine-binding protein [Candidatus Onthovivens sp.]|nr:phosphopantetheine-binding protein [Candidatus Onthovivens sp.]